MICSNCKSEQNELSKYCTNCGSKLIPDNIHKEQIIESNNSTDIKHKKWKYGWGWMILGAMLTRENKEFNIYFGNNASLIQLFSFAVAFTFYFLFRQKVLKRINQIALRSFVSGILALIITIPLASILGAFINKPVNDPNVTSVIEAKLKQQKEYLYLFAKKDESLWNKFIDEPKSTNEINSNISLLDELIPLYKEKDSILISTYTDISQVMESSVEWKSKVPELVKDFRSITEIGYSLSIQNQSYLNNLRNYYISINKKDNQEDKYYNLYVESYNKSQELTKELNPKMIRITGKNFEKLQEEVEKEYYNK